MTVGAWSSKKISSGAELYIRKSTPRKEPVKFGPNTKQGIRTAHNASVKTVNVTKSTVGMINNASPAPPNACTHNCQAISKVVETTFETVEKGVTPVVDAGKEKYNEVRRGSQVGQRSPPPLPSRREDGQAASTSSPRSGSPALPPRNTALAQHVSLPTRTETLLAEENDQTPPATNGRRGSESVPITSMIQGSPRRDSQPSAQRKRPFFNRLLLAGEVVLTSIEATAQDLINSSTVAASNAAG